MDENLSRELDTLTLHHQTDVCRLWELLMGPLGFSSRSVWLTFVTRERRPVRAITQVAESGAGGEPTRRDVDNLFAMLRDLLDDPDADIDSDCSVALLVSRPGRHGRDGADLALARMLVDGARRHGVPLEPVHLATDRAVEPLAADDLAA